jgi:protein-tyrosine kinase
MRHCATGLATAQFAGTNGILAMKRIEVALERAARDQEPTTVERAVRYQEATTGNLGPKSVLPKEGGESPLQESLASGIRHRIIEAPRERLLRERVLCSGCPPEFQEPYRVLRARILQRMREGARQMLGVASPGPKEGKTLTSINLAISFSREIGRQALLIDADLRAPHVHECFGLGGVPGLSEYLTGKLGLEDVLINPGVPGLEILPGGQPVEESAELLGCARMAHLIQGLRAADASRFVLVDLPGILHSADVLTFSRHLDAVLLVVQCGKTRTSDLKRALELVGGERICGVVLNKAAGRVTLPGR